MARFNIETEEEKQENEGLTLHLYAGQQACFKQTEDKVFVFWAIMCRPFPRISSDHQSKHT